MGAGGMIRRMRYPQARVEPDRGEERLGEPGGDENAEGQVAIASEWCAPCTGSERGEAERDRVERVRRNGTLHLRNLTTLATDRIIERLYESGADTI